MRFLIEHYRNNRKFSISFKSALDEEEIVDEIKASGKLSDGTLLADSDTIFITPLEDTKEYTYRTARNLIERPRTHAY